MDHVKQYRAKSGHIQLMPSDRALMEIIEGDNATGFCLVCGEWVEGVEPDTERDDCPHCGAAKVFGAENLMIRGLCYDGDRAEDIAREGGRA